MGNTALKILFSLFLITLTVVAVVGTLFYLNISSFIKTPLNPDGREKVFNILPGQSLYKIAENLENDALISNQTYFKIYVRIKKSGKKLQAGEYLLSASQTPEGILSMLVSGKIKLNKITIPEGWSIKEIASVTAKSFPCQSEEFNGLCLDRDFITSLKIKANSLEGYLFPDTYFFPSGADCRTIISSMVKRFHEVFTKEWLDRADQMGMTVHEIVTLASIIEKETGDPQERPLISSVFHNRLKRKMRLESDPTVIYGIKNFDGNIKRKHLKMLTPYNTYQIKGLPVGPIASPGAKSLEAALFPVTSDYLFFVSKKDTTHYFSKTIDEHNKAVRKYQLGKN